MHFEQGRFLTRKRGAFRSVRTFVHVGLLLACEFFLLTQLNAGIILPGLATNLVCHYDFDHPVAGNADKETDLGSSGTALNLINGGAAMRTNDSAYPVAGLSLQTQQLNPTDNGNDDWKAGVYETNGVATLSAFNAVTGITLMGWIKPTGMNPNLNSTTPLTDDYYNAIGLFGLLSGTSEGHGVRALVEIINVSGTPRLVALGRRDDAGSSMTLAATNDWQTLLPSNTWTHITATFDFDNGTMALYRNGELLPTFYTPAGDPWNVIGDPEPDTTSPSNPAGIKIGGSFPQNSVERNAFNGRFDDLMFFNRSLTAEEVQAQFANFTAPQTNTPPKLSINYNTGHVTLGWSLASADYSLESDDDITAPNWPPVNVQPATNGDTISVTLPAGDTQQFFRLKRL